MYKLDEKIRREGGLEGCLLFFYKGMLIVPFVVIAVFGAISLIIYFFK